MESTGNLILAIETIIEGGSFSVFDTVRKTEIIGWTGKDKISKAEDVLENLAFLFEKSGINKKSIGLILCAAEAGSVTGFKIGSAIAKGLAKSLGCRSVEISLWIAFSNSNSNSKMPGDDLRTEKIFYLPSGRDKILRRVLFANEFKDNGNVIDAEQFIEEIKNFSLTETVSYVYESLFKLIEGGTANRIHVIEKNLASYLTNNYASDNESSI